ncbi:MAG TPA: pyridoxamine 5'-phosphate oxidase family protein [Parafilimonas sp.]|nr:pyridoxamine 5'-phosphate oxidase family protein [Parafilimonas sp.]
MAQVIFTKNKIMFGHLKDDAIETVLHHQVIGHLACHANDTTYVVPISYAYENGYVYAHAEEGMKISMMRKNSKVCFEVYRMENMGNWQSVIGWGNFEEIIDEKERAEALKILLKRDLPIITSKTVQLTTDWPFLPEDLNEIKGVVFRIKLDTKTGRYERTEEVNWW